jgi:hypothetical protein
VNCIRPNKLYQKTAFDALAVVSTPDSHELGAQPMKLLPASSAALTFRSVVAGKKMLVGAVGIENNNIWNFKDLEEMPGNAKALKRNNRECKEILIGPSMAPHFSGAEIPFLFRSTKSGVGFRSNLAARMASRRPHRSIG